MAKLVKVVYNVDDESRCSSLAIMAVIMLQNVRMMNG